MVTRVVQHHILDCEKSLAVVIEIKQIAGDLVSHIDPLFIVHSHNLGIDTDDHREVVDIKEHIESYGGTVDTVGGGDCPKGLLIQCGILSVDAQHTPIKVPRSDGSVYLIFDRSPVSGGIEPSSKSHQEGYQNKSFLHSRYKICLYMPRIISLPSKIESASPASLISSFLGARGPMDLAVSLLALLVGSHLLYSSLCQLVVAALEFSCRLIRSLNGCLAFIDIFPHGLLSFVILPFPFSDSPIRICYFAFPVPFTVGPLPFEYSPIVPIVFAETALFIELIVADILPSIFPSVSPEPMHHVVFPAAFIHSTIKVLVSA